MSEDFWTVPEFARPVNLDANEHYDVVTWARDSHCQAWLIVTKQVWLGVSGGPGPWVPREVHYTRAGGRGGMDITDDFRLAEVVARGDTKWDGCVNWETNPGLMAHCCDAEQVQAFCEALRAAYALEPPESNRG